MTDKQMVKVQRNAYKYYDEVIHEHKDWSKYDIAMSSFQAGADYVLKNKHELKEKQNNKKPNAIQFLKDNGVYEMFMNNMFNLKTKEYIQTYLIECINERDAILGAFSWASAPEGAAFWNEIHDLWTKQF